MNKRLIIITLTSIFFLVSCQNIEDNNHPDESQYLDDIEGLSSTIQELENANSILENKIIELENKLNVKSEFDEVNSIDENNVDSVHLVEGHIHLYAQVVEADNFVYKPAYGPIADLNPYALNIEQSIKVLESNEYYSKIQIEGYIPTWYLENEIYSLSNVNSDQYVIRDSNLYLSPDDNTYVLRHISAGRAADIIYEYKEWFYVHMYYYADANDFQYGWIHKRDLGDVSDFESKINLDVELISGTTAYDTIKEVYGESESVWGYIMNEEETSYTLMFPGAYFLEVDKDEVRFIVE